MFKTNNKAFAQQRAVLKPIKNAPFFDSQHPNGILERVGEEEEDEEEEEDIFVDDNSSCSINHNGASARSDTLLLAQFLSSTGPEEYVKQDTKKQQQFKKASRLLNRLRKKPTMSALNSGLHHQQQELLPTATSHHFTGASTEKKNYIPLPVYDSPDHHHHRNSNNHPQQLYKAVTTSNPSNQNRNNGSKNTGTTTTTSKKTATKYATPTSAPSSSIAPSVQRQQHPANAGVLRDSGVYSETTLEKDSPLTLSHSNQSSNGTTTATPPLPRLTSVLGELNFPNPPCSIKQVSNNPRRPVPLPPAVASAAIATAFPSSIRSVPEAALKRRSVRLRHVQVQTTTEVQDDKPIPSTLATGDQQACPFCRQHIGNNTKDANRLRRPSCPPALSSGPTLLSQDNKDDAKMLLGMIMKLKSQLEEEKQCRLELEKVMRQDRSMILAKEKDRWVGDCLWLDDRIALLPE